MKIIYFNCRGLVGPLKRTSLYRLVDLNKPDIMLLHETMGEEAVIILCLFSLFRTREFVGSYAKGRSGDLTIRWNPKIVKVLNSWGFASRFGLNIQTEEIGLGVAYLNLYVPYQERRFFWKALAHK